MIHYCEHNVLRAECPECRPPTDQGDMSSEPKARRTDPATSHVAALMVDAEGQRGKIMAVLRGKSFQRWGLPGDPDEGWTADELDTVLRWRVTTAGRRLSELKRRELVIPCGERLTRSGRMATVYRINE